MKDVLTSLIIVDTCYIKTQLRKVYDKG